ncbi:P-loop ATPase, Sll1717 family [Kouleothrix sp.]|uniref:P-loop ATPase, Sll1717 family n=1 Tax=Kouleothrix sp. TaxID=2779161 RepID=UPI003919D0FC
MQNKIDTLRELDLGAIVAEQDRLLNQCFVSHPVLSEILFDRKDLVLGAKGSGKSALWKEFVDRQTNYSSLNNVHIRLVTNPSGDPEFRDILAAISTDEFPDAEELRTGWRLYFISQFWKAADEVTPDTRDKKTLEKSLTQYGLISNNSGTLKTTFAFALAKARALKKLDVQWIKGLSLEFGEVELRAGGSAAAIPFNAILSDIDKLLAGANRRVWLILDRLDEIILGDEERENQVLKGLLLAYRDVSDYISLRVKVFIRDDVYSRVTALGHFPALTHIRSRAAGPIEWKTDDLLHLVVRRLLVNECVVKLLEVHPDDVSNTIERYKLFYQLFPSKVDKGRAAQGFKWIYDRIIDGNNVATPRDLLSVFEAARVFQLEQLERERIPLPEKLLFTEDSLRKSVRKVAQDNLETRIYAEYPDLVEPIKAFAGGKADHNEQTLRRILGSEYEKILPRLERVGFIHRRTRQEVEMWTIPFFYSFALDIKRGAAFDLPIRKPRTKNK